MHRTQVLLKESERRVLHLISQKEHASLSELIRRSIEKVYFKEVKDRNLEKAIDSIAGIWAKRTELGSTERYVRSLRKGERLAKFYGESAG